MMPDEAALNRALLQQPHEFRYRFTPIADSYLRELLFRSIANNREDYLRYFFPDGAPYNRNKPWSLRKAQGAVDGAEYTAAARGTPCGHIFKSGESTYHCKTCAADDTCVLCARCFESSEHQDHMVFISQSPGNSGCCDCGDQEAWVKDVRCSIHSPNDSHDHGVHGSAAKEKGNTRPTGAGLPPDLIDAMRMTISRAINYLCDVFSCSPEQMRLKKTEESILNNERTSRLSPTIYGEEHLEADPEFVLVLWNDEKHTVDDVQNQVARACSATKSFGYEKAMEVNDVGRSCVFYSRNVPQLIRMAEIIEQLKLSVTIRSTRDTFREQMCSTIIDWIADIAGCSVGDDAQILRNIICEELLNTWIPGSEANNKDIGQAGIDDHEGEVNIKVGRHYAPAFVVQQGGTIRVELEIADVGMDQDVDDEDGDEEEEEYDVMDMEDEEGAQDDGQADNQAQGEMSVDDFINENDEATDEFGATTADYPVPPPPPPPAQSATQQSTPLQPEADDVGDLVRPARNAPFGYLPRTPKVDPKKRKMRPGRHWLEKPDGFLMQKSTEPHEDLWQRIRLDLLILYDLRLWKTLRIKLRHLYIATVVSIPRFKRVLGLRFAVLYTALAQLYLIADREPDHSIINLSLQMLTTPTITQEVVERANFFTNLMAILYTFLTTRQVGFPEDVDPRATLAFDAGAITNRRMFHFFLDLRYLCQSEFIKFYTRTEPRYLLQFIDLVKLHQGVCPNTRAVGAHIEYEPDTWISASVIVKEINKLCRQIAVSFEPNLDHDYDIMHVRRAVRTIAKVVMINSFGYERDRFEQAEAKKDMAWHIIGPFPFGDRHFSVPNHLVQAEPTSFHHPLHYLLSWMLENSKSLDRETMRALLTFSLDDLRDPWNATNEDDAPSNLTSDELLSSIFEHPLCTCVWLAQMKAGMWVRNGVTLRHQAHTYRSVSNRDIAYQRDIFMLQAGLVLCGNEEEPIGERFLAQMIDRFEMTSWVKGDFNSPQGFDEGQRIDVIEDFFHYMIVALSERGNLMLFTDPNDHHEWIVRRDIAHVLCFKPLSFSDLVGRVTEKVGESNDFTSILESMTNFKPPEGLTDSGTFELRRELIQLVDPYYAHYSRNQREEAETLHKRYIASTTGKKLEDVVYEPHLPRVDTGLFKDIAAVTRTPLFTRLCWAALSFAVNADIHAPEMQKTRIESFLNMVLYLIILATTEDCSDGKTPGFIQMALDTRQDDALAEDVGIIGLLATISKMDAYAGCHAAAQNILRKMQARYPSHLDTLLAKLNASLERADAGSPASFSADDKEKRKQEALARQARVMAQMKQQQNSFLQNQGLEDLSNEFEDMDDMSITEETPDLTMVAKTWDFPVGTCILCQEETDDRRLFGTFAYLGESHILRSTPIEDPDYVREVLETPSNLDRPLSEDRPFGVAGNNKQIKQKATPSGEIIDVMHQGLSKGFPHRRERVAGPVSTSCGHIMHFSCFELYQAATARRHSQQIARNHPEWLEHKEFTCPLCKALGNTFLPIIWKGKQCVGDHELHAASPLADWLQEHSSMAVTDFSFLEGTSLPHKVRMEDEYARRMSAYVSENVVPSIASGLQELSTDATPTSHSRPAGRRSYSLSTLFRMNHGDSQSSIDTTGLSPTTSEAPQRANELIKAYERIDETVRANNLCATSQGDLVPFNIANTLSRALGFSVSAYEIARRGTAEHALSTSIVSELTEQSLTQLRILSETVESYQAVQILRSSAVHGMSRDAVKQREIMTALLFGVDSELAMFKIKEFSGKFLFEDDIFLFFVDWLSILAPNIDDATNILQVCLWAEIVKALFVMRAPVVELETGNGTVQSGEVSAAFKLAVSGIAMDEMEASDLSAPFNPLQLQMLRSVVDKYALAFLRKAIVVMHIRYGLDYNCPYDLDLSSPEQQRLTALLHVASVEEMFELYTSQSTASETLRRMTKQWIHQANTIAARAHATGKSPIVVPHPAIFELVGLPFKFDVLTDVAIHLKCPTTGKEMTDPAVCLMCGDIFCSQAFCCMTDKNKGGCYQHMKRCGMKVGIFLNLRKCMIFFSHGPANGCFTHAPYLDRHGEPDPTLRRHHQLFLNQRRYDKLLREIWLTHMIPTVISRKLEGDTNPGGWETL